MRALPCFCLALSLLTACSAPPDTAIATKAMLLSEALEEGTPCDGMKLRLKDPALTTAGLQGIYAEAKKSGCLKRDI